MATRTVRLDTEAERTLASLTKTTGMSISEVLKRGLLAYKQQVQELPARVSAYDILQRLDLGPGGYAQAPAREAKGAIKLLLRRKHRK